MLAEARGSKTNAHLAITDATGDSAIIEYIGGKLVVHHGHEYRVMTNDSSYDQQLAMLAQQDFTKPTSDTVVSGNVNPRDRFARASYFLASLSKAERQLHGAAGGAIARNVWVPFGALYKGFGIYNTE